MAKYSTVLHAEPQEIRAFLAYAIYADYDANAPTSEDLVLLSTEELAKDVCGILNENPRLWGNLAFTDGFEHCKRFVFHATAVLKPGAIRRSVAEAFETDIGEGYEQDGDSEED